MVDREPYIEAGDGGVAGIVAGLLIAALIVVGLFLFTGTNRLGSQTIDLDVPAVTVNVTPDGQ